MNPELARLLSEAGITEKIGWQNIVALQNYAPLPAVVRTGSAPWSRGLNLAVVLRGQPLFFCKCRPANDVVIERETAIRSTLAGDRPGGISVAPVRLVSSARISVQVSPFVPGAHYGRFVPTQSASVYLATLRMALVGMATLADLAVRECPFVRPPVPSVLLSAAAADCLRDLAARAGLDANEEMALISAVHDAGEVPSRPQHGDFWWQNLLVTKGQLWAIDFDGYGEVSVPLYDDLTLMLTTMVLRAGGVVGGLVRLMSTDAEAIACRALLAERAASERVRDSQLDGILVYYLTHIAFTVQRRGSSEWAAPHFEAVRYVAKRLANGDRSLLSPG